MFLHTATTKGYNGGNYEDYPLNTRSIYENLADEGLNWEIYFQDFTTAHGISPLNTYTDQFIEDYEFKHFQDTIKQNKLTKKVVSND